mmetsp:Transcript_2030/g.4808  ORF Transcript_2030/g.4808 Transcript_2030/m.4808 type:complete len:204 (+) Transcript_2030:2-613(+)
MNSTDNEDDSSLSSVKTVKTHRVWTSCPHHNDVLCWRGGTINDHDHPGNKQYRKLVDSKRAVYLNASFEREKKLVATRIVEQVRSLNPPGRFLIRKNWSTWFDIGDAKARENVSQDIRENALASRKRKGAEFAETRDPEEVLRLSTNDQSDEPMDTLATRLQQFCFDNNIEVDFDPNTQVLNPNTGECLVLFSISGQVLPRSF